MSPFFQKKNYKLMFSTFNCQTFYKVDDHKHFSHGRLLATIQCSGLFERCFSKEVFFLLVCITIFPGLYLHLWSFIVCFLTSGHMSLSYKLICILPRIGLSLKMSSSSSFRSLSWPTKGRVLALLFFHNSGPKKKINTLLVFQILSSRSIRSVFTF